MSIRARYIPALAGLLIIPFAQADDRHTLTTDHLEAVVNLRTGALVSILNKHTGHSKTVYDVPFTIFTDRGTCRSDRIPVKASHGEALSATINFLDNDVEVSLTYRVRSPQAHFVEKLLIITNRHERPLVVEEIVLQESAFMPPPVQVAFHRGGIAGTHRVASPDIPINLFLRDSRGGLFAGIENPYFGLVKRGNVLSLQFRPRWRLKPGNSFESDPAFFGVYKAEGIYATKSTIRSKPDEPLPSGPQEILDWGEVWAMQDFMRQVLTSDRPPGNGYPVIYNACGGMEYLWRLRDENQSKTAEENSFVRHFAGSSPWTKEIVHGKFRPAWIEPFRILVDHLAEIGQVNILHPGTLWTGNGGFWDKEESYLAGRIEPNSYWLELKGYARKRGIDLYGFECPGSGYFPDRPDWKYVDRGGKTTGWNCYANEAFVAWHRETISRVIKDHQLPWWQWDEGWADVANGECYASNHGHTPGDVSYAVYRNIQATTAELKRRHPGLWLVGISVFQHHAPWILRTVDETVTWGDAWYAHNFLFIPPGKKYIGDFMPRGEKPEYNFFRNLSLADHLNVGQPLWVEDRTKREALRGFWQKWMAWASRNAELFRERRDLFGPAQELQGSAHLSGGRGLLFIFNPGRTDKTAAIPLDRRIGAQHGRQHQVHQIHPGALKFGVYATGDEVLALIPAGEAVILEITPTEAPRALAVSSPSGKPVRAFLTLSDLLGQLTEQDIWAVP